MSKNKCVGCGICESQCPTGAVFVDKAIGIAVINKDECKRCEMCLENCPQNAIRDITDELVIAIGTDDGKTIKPDNHFGMSQYFLIWKYANGRLDFIEKRENVKYQEDETKIHGDPGKAKATASALKGVDVLVGKMMGPNIDRLKNKFVPVIIREPLIEEANKIIRNSINEIVEEKEKGERRGIILT
ncbi:MAG: 4Fe-4S binding protein [Candidatus Aureabacteria bacterium]|nr:4Fe-4S binding protein [Candidatus Auribacterota bacterium]